MEKTNIAGVAKDVSVARIALVGLQHNPGVAFKVFETGITALVILSFYMLISDKLKDKKYRDNKGLFFVVDIS